MVAPDDVLTNDPERMLAASGTLQRKPRDDRDHCKKEAEVNRARKSTDPPIKNGEVKMPVQQCTAESATTGDRCKCRTQYGQFCNKHLPIMQKVRIKKYDGMGRGLEATEELAKHQDILSYTGDIYYDATHKPPPPGSDYVLELCRSVVIDAARTNSSVGRLINDPKGTGKRANAAFVVDRKNKTVKIRTTRVIKPGEQILISYGAQYWVDRIDRNNLQAHRVVVNASLIAGVDLPTIQSCMMSQINAASKDPLPRDKASTENHTQLLAANAELERLTTTIHPSTAALGDPASYKEILSRPDVEHWKAARMVEHHNHMKNGTYIIVPRSEIPEKTKLLTWREVFKVKRGPDGKPVSYKARSTMRGCQQTQDMYGDITANVFTMRTLRTLCALVAIYDWDFKQLDVEAAFLQSLLQETIYAVAPKDVGIASDKVIKLLRSIYGLKQSNHNWQVRLFTQLISMCYIQLKYIDCCVFIRVLESGRLLIIIVYVDDIPYAYDKRDKAEMDKDIEILSSVFKLKLLGDAHYILGWRITRDRARKVLELDMAGYITQTLEEFGMENCKPSKVPGTDEKTMQGLAMEAQPTIATSMASATNADAEDDTCGNIVSKDYRKVVGCLLWITQLRPAILHAVTQLAAYTNDPKPYHLKAAKKVLRYLKGTWDHTLKYDGTVANASQLNTSSDSNWAGCPATSKSTSGYVIRLAGGAISYFSKKQTVIADSSLFAETIAGVEAYKELQWLDALLMSLRVEQYLPHPILMDNQSAMALAKGGGNHSKTKHVRIRFHQLEEGYENKFIDLKYVPTEENRADIFTKALDANKFNQHAKAIMGHEHD